MKLHEIGKWAFLIGIVLSIASAFTANFISITTMALFLFILGLGVGFLNVTRKDTVTFLLAVLVLLALGAGGIAALSQISVLGIYTYLAAMLGSFISFVGAAGLVIAIRAVLDTTESVKIFRKKK
jgi:hypothetical protein